MGWCDLFLDQRMLNPEVGEFEVEKKLIGKGGCNTKGIFLATGSKILVCGQGAERGKVRRKKVTNDHLRIEIISDRQAYASFKRAFEMVIKLVGPITEQFDHFCVRHLKHKFDGTRYWIGSTTQQALDCLGSSLNRIAIAEDALEDGLKESYPPDSAYSQRGDLSFGGSDKEVPPPSDPAAPTNAAAESLHGRAPPPPP